MQWFRLYNDLRHDPKVQNLRPELFRFWINLLCMASDQKARGTVPSLDAIATDLGMRRDHVERFMSALEASNLVIRGSLGASNGRLRGALDAFEIHGWGGRQPKSDDVAERVKRHREKAYDKKDGETSVDEKRYADGPCNVLDSDTDSETDHHHEEGDVLRPSAPEISPPASPPPTPDIIRLPPSSPALPSSSRKDCPNFPPPDGPIEMTPGHHPMEEADARKVFALLWQAFGEAKMCYDFYQRQQRFPFEFWVAGVRETAKTGKAINALGYVEKVILGFKGKVPAVERLDAIEIKPPPKQPTYHKARSTRPMKFVMGGGRG